MNYLAFIRNNKRFLLFGLLLTLFSGYGQTYFIALFNAELMAQFGLSHGGFGGVYSLATLCSALCLVWAGRQIDRVDLRPYTAMVCLGLALACVITAAAQNVLMLGVGMFGLRIAGQGLMTHTAVTSMARYFEKERGKAVSFSAFGHPVSQAVLPALAVGLIGQLGWRAAWVVLAVLLLAVILPVLLWLLKGHSTRHARMLAENAEPSRFQYANRQWQLGDVLRDAKFYLILPAVICPALVFTGMFFHQIHLVSVKGWSPGWYATTFTGFAAGSIAAMLLSGILVDQFGSRRLLLMYLVPQALSLFAVGVTSHPAVVPVYLLLAGLSMGSGFTLSGSLWPELYGISHLGAIRSLVQALTVLSTAVAPVAMGVLIDRGVTMDTLSLAGCGLTIGAALMAWWGVREKPATAAT